MNRQRCSCVVLLLLFLFFSGCARFSEESVQQETVHTAFWQSSDSREISPLFTTLGSEREYNRIGTVEAIDQGDSALVRVNGQKPTIYKEVSIFKTAGGRYENSVYRVHFERTPFSLFPFYLTGGKHPGLLVILTRDGQGHLILVTTVHTCGCYVASIPTGWLNEKAFPPDWPEEKINIYGEVLPARLPAVKPGQSIEFVIRPETHRIMDVKVMENLDFTRIKLVRADVKSQQSLRSLQTPSGREVSFYYNSWPLKGHVKGAFKWWEMLLLSLPSLDLFVGMDKDYGSTELTGNSFYTSLQPWFRSSSDMNDFASFLHFHGWEL